MDNERVSQTKESMTNEIAFAKVKSLLAEFKIDSTIFDLLNTIIDKGIENEKEKSTAKEKLLDLSRKKVLDDDLLEFLIAKLKLKDESNENKDLKISELVKKLLDARDMNKIPPSEYHSYEMVLLNNKISGSKKLSLINSAQALWNLNVITREDCLLLKRKIAYAESIETTPIASVPRNISYGTTKKPRNISKSLNSEKILPLLLLVVGFLMLAFSAANYNIFTLIEDFRKFVIYANYYLVSLVIIVVSMLTLFKVTKLDLLCHLTFYAISACHIFNHIVFLTTENDTMGSIIAVLIFFIISVILYTIGIKMYEHGAVLIVIALLLTAILIINHYADIYPAQTITLNIDGETIETVVALIEISKGAILTTLVADVTLIGNIDF